MDLALLFSLLGVPQRDGARALMFAARATHHGLPYVVLSMLVRDGVELSSASRDELLRAQARHAELTGLVGKLATVSVVVPIRGATQSHVYPSDLLYASSTIALAIDTEEALWRCAGWILNDKPVERIEITVIDSRHRDVMVALTWSVGDLINDPPCRVELTTAALPGDFHSVPVRYTLPDDPPTAALVAVAEERLWRHVQIQDVLRVLTLARFGTLDTAKMVQAIVDHHLAPEALELVELAGEYGELSDLALLASALPGPAADERQRRLAGPRREGANVRYGLELRRAQRGARSDWVTSHSHISEAGELFCTPIGDYLLVESAAVSESAQAEALRELVLHERTRSLHEQSDSVPRQTARSAGK